MGCPDFPLWNGYPGLFASLVTGNPVVVAPHPRSVLPLAITVRVARQVLAEAGHSPTSSTLAVAEPERQVHRRLATDPAVRIVDYTGSARFADWLEQHARQAAVFADRTRTEHRGRGLDRRLPGPGPGSRPRLVPVQRDVRTTPQNILVPERGFSTDEGHKTLRTSGPTSATPSTGCSAIPPARQGCWARSPPTRCAAP